MTGPVLLASLIFGILLVPVAFAQLLYMESVRLRTRERAALEFFKSSLQPRFGLESDRGILTFALAKHTLLVLLGACMVIIACARDGGLQAADLVQACGAALVTMLVSTYGIPHILYRRSEGHWVLACLPLLRAVALAARPFVWLFEFLQSLSELGESEEAQEEQQTPTDNIEALISAGAEEGLIEESDRELIQSVVEFGDKTVREVMTPRPNIVAIDVDRPLEDLRQLVIQEQYSRIPVYEGSIDRVIGFVHVRDMFELDDDERKTKKVRDLVRPIRFVPETKFVNALLKEMQQDRAHMAIAVDEYGNTAGLVTLEDLVEEVFGEIRDEHEPGLDIAQDSEGNYVVSGNFGVDRLEDLLHQRLDEETESTTVGGLVMEWLGRVPHAGEAVERDGIRIEVLASDELRVAQVRISQTQRNHV